jgi:hypothetical protein
MTEAVKEVVGTSFAFVVGLSDNQQITFQSGFASDESDAVIHARIDRLARIARRSQLLAETPKLREERSDLLSQKAQRRDDHAQAQAAYERAVQEIEARKQATFDVGYTEHVRGGKQAPYEPRGAAKATIANCQAELDKMAAERDVALKAHTTFNERIDLRVAAIDEKLSEAAALTLPET